MNEYSFGGGKLGRQARADAQEDQGRRHLAAGRNGASISCFTVAIRLDSNIADYYVGRALAYASRGDYDMAIESFTTAIGLDWECAAAYNGRGLAYAMIGDYESAIVNHDEALRIDPGNDRAQLGREASRLLSGNCGARD